MSHFILSPLAQADLGDIWDYSAERFGLDRAEKYLREIQSAIELMASSPQRHRACDDIRQGYYKYLTGSHLLFFRRIDNGIDIVRILHARMDFGQHLP